MHNEFSLAISYVMKWNHPSNFMHMKKYESVALTSSSVSITQQADMLRWYIINVIGTHLVEQQPWSKRFLAVLYLNLDVQLQDWVWPD